MPCSAEIIIDFLWGRQLRHDVPSPDCFPCGSALLLGTHLLCAGLRHCPCLLGFYSGRKEPWDITGGKRASVANARRGSPHSTVERRRAGSSLTGRWWWEKAWKDTVSNAKEHSSPGPFSNGLQQAGSKENADLLGFGPSSIIDPSSDVWDGALWPDWSLLPCCGHRLSHAGEIPPQEGFGPSAAGCAGRGGAEQCPASSRKLAGPRRRHRTPRGPAYSLKWQVGRRPGML